MRWCSQIILSTLFLLTCRISADSFANGEVNVSAALSLKMPFEEIGMIYERKYPGTKATFNFGPSGMLQKQIEAGAPVDLFASASPKEMDALENSGLVLADSRHEFARNEIVLIAARNANVLLRSFSDLTGKEIRRIAIGNPATVPAGKYAEETLKTLGILESLRPKLINAEHVRQVMDYVVRGEVDAGIVFLTDARARGGELRIAAAAPAASHKPAVYVVAAVKGTKKEAAARQFITLVLSKEGREVLRKHGFTLNP